MNNTENKIKTYLISFGNSDKYVLRDTETGEKSALTRIESELNAYLRERFPDETFAYFTTPRVDEISSEDTAGYEEYPRLDKKAIDSIKVVLDREVMNMEANTLMDRNALYADVNPAAVDLPFGI